jgi:hypothetical protein
VPPIPPSACIHAADCTIACSPLQTSAVALEARDKGRARSASTTSTATNIKSSTSLTGSTNCTQQQGAHNLRSQCLHTPPLSDLTRVPHSLDINPSIPSLQHRWSSSHLQAHHSAVLAGQVLAGVWECLQQHPAQPCSATQATSPHSCTTAAVPQEANNTTR